MSLSAEQITTNWDRFLLEIQNNIPGERGKILYKFYDKYADRFAMMPASGKISFHNAFPGGYIDHVLRVLDLSLKVRDLWDNAGASVPDLESIAFVAINHDLGKFGDIDHEEYLDETEDYWKKKGQLYKHNPEINFMKTSERSLFLLQQIGVKISQEEYLGIRLHDGLYEEGNKGYYIAYSDEYRLRSNLPYIVHQADLLATRIEHDGIGENVFNTVTKELTQKVKTMPARPKITGHVEKTLTETNLINKTSKNKYAKMLNNI